jgi:dolichol-phosphate mannosyltransferase
VTATDPDLRGHEEFEERYVGRAHVVCERPVAVPAPTSRPRQTVVIPTCNERENVPLLLNRLTQVLPPVDTQVVFVDDSTDDTPEVITAAAQQCPLPVQVHHRERGVGGLGGAVVEGFKLARGDWIVVMDADLQHPPEVVPDLIAAGVRDGADLVVGSRYTAGGGRSGLAGGYRRLVSAASTVATKVLFRTALIRMSDPMSGFFAVRASSLDVDTLQPFGYKILLELVVRNRPGRVVELPYEFRQRHAGQSKSSLREGLRFLRHVAMLRFGATRLRMLAFTLIGAVGLVPNTVALWLLSGVFGLDYLVAAVLANQAALACNFALADMLLFRGRRHRPLIRRLFSFYLLGNADLVLRVPAMALLVADLHTNYLAANLLALVASSLLRFLMIDRLIYTRRAARSASGIATPVTYIAEPVRLMEKS